MGNHRAIHYRNLQAPYLGSSTSHLYVQSVDAGESFTFTDDPTEEIEQIVAVTDEGYRTIFESPNK